MENLKVEIIKEIKEETEKLINKLDSPEGLNNLLSNYHKKYKIKPKERFIKFLMKKAEKETEEKLNKIKAVTEAEDFKGDFIITIEATKNNMWGYTFKGYGSNSFKGSVVSGCGYDKTSTATAEVLNSNLSILKLLYIAKDKAITEHKHEKNPDNTYLRTSDINRNYLGYGSGYGILPNFEGGVGVSCHIRILKELGLIMEHITDTKNTDVYLIRRV